MNIDWGETGAMIAAVTCIGTYMWRLASKIERCATKEELGNAVDREEQRLNAEIRAVSKHCEDTYARKDHVDEKFGSIRESMGEMKADLRLIRERITGAARFD